jgi:hypothetical protein
MNHLDSLKLFITPITVSWFQHLQHTTSGKKLNTGKLINVEAIGMNTIKAFLLINPGLGKKLYNMYILTIN